MTPERSSPPSAAQPALAAYSILCFTALMGMVLVLMEDERELTWLPVIGRDCRDWRGGRWRAAPPLLLLGLAALELYHRIIWSTFYRPGIGRRRDSPTPCFARRYWPIQRDNIVCCR